MNRANFRAIVSFHEYLEFLGKKPSESHLLRGEKRDLQQNLSRMQVSLYDGSEKMTARAWLQTYLTLCP